MNARQSTNRLGPAGPLALAIILCACGPTPLRRDVCDVFGSGIVNGTPCDALRGAVVEVTSVFDVGQGERRQGCTGALISDRFVLTAAHCFEPPGSRSAKRAEVVIEGRRLTSTWFVTHPDATFQRVPGLSLDSEVGINDVALIRLEAPVSSTTLRLGRGSTARPGDVLTIAGFGLDGQGARGVLNAGQLRLAQVLPGQLVAAVDPSGATTCFGDSGGPAIADLMGAPTVVGVASSAVVIEEVEGGATCREASAVFINLGSPPVARFIEGVIANNSGP